MNLYMDAAASTPVLPEAQAAIVEALATYGNPSSLHRLGMEAENILRLTRAEVLRALGIQQDAGIVFTSGGTEANNLAIFGITARHKQKPKHIVTTAIEHPSVLEPMKALERIGWRVTYIKPNLTQAITAEDVLAAIEIDTVLVSVMHINNETGCMLPVAQIGAALRKQPKVSFHVDGTQAFGKLPTPMHMAQADLYTVSGHKVGAIKGIGALAIRFGLQLQPQILGGHQEQGLRSGTENVIGVRALRAVITRSSAQLNERWQHVEKLNRQLRSGLLEIPCASVLELTDTSPYILHVSFAGIRGEVLLHALEKEGLFVSTGSACSSRHDTAAGSHVLQAMGLSDREIRSSIRFSLGFWHTEEDIRTALEITERQVMWLQSLLR